MIFSWASPRSPQLSRTVMAPGQRCASSIDWSRWFTVTVSPGRKWYDTASRVRAVTAAKGWKLRRPGVGGL